eukprot:TRINITY_DN54754_c0_g1_i1.p1 TRINITY_DN54754_c0_g1~~TRINITY_DN54754_c0_g1_i1.p1  ORF type:complete len:522 (+),score=168.01 TRINITY_DN54754_c0_g1_i1:96-1661(+)
MAGRAWLVEHGEGRIRKEDVEGLRQALLADLRDAGADTASPQTQLEVQRFLENGRASANNFVRLRRRVLDGGSRSARSEAGGRLASSYGQAPSELSASSPLALARGGAAPASRDGGGSALGGRQPLSARPAYRGGGSSTAGSTSGYDYSAAAARAGAPAAALSLSGGNDLDTWADVAAHAQLMEAIDKKKKRDVLKAQQAAMRQELQQQMSQRAQRKQEAKAESAMDLSDLQVNLEKFQEHERQKRELQRQKAVEITRERNEQAAHNSAERQRQHEEKIAEDRRLADLARRQLEIEQHRLLQKKEKNKAVLAKVAQESVDKSSREEEKRRQQMEERQKVKEYHDMLEMQERRNKVIVPPARGDGIVRNVAHLLRPGDEYYSEESIAQQFEEALRLRDLSEEQKIQSKKMALERHREYLAQQIMEKERRRREALESKGEQRKLANAASEAFVEGERDRLANQRLRDAQYRQDLDEQIRIRRSRPKDDKNKMTEAERAINKHLIQDARELRKEIALMASRGEV